VRHINTARTTCIDIASTLLSAAASPLSSSTGWPRVARSSALLGVALAGAAPRRHYNVNGNEVKVGSTIRWEGEYAMHCQQCARRRCCLSLDAALHPAHLARAPRLVRQCGKQHGECAECIPHARAMFAPSSCVRGAGKSYLCVGTSVNMRGRAHTTYNVRAHAHTARSNRGCCDAKMCACKAHVLSTVV
jgi:hypothetical protein